MTYILMTEHFMSFSQQNQITIHTDHHYRWQIAIKSKGETARSEVIEISWQVGRTGTITPWIRPQECCCRRFRPTGYG